MSANTLELCASETDHLGHSWNILCTLNQFVSSVVCICKRTWDVAKSCEWHHAWTDVQGIQDTCNWEKKMHQCIFHSFPRKTATASYQIKSSCLWELLLRLLPKGEGKKQVSGFHRKRMIPRLWLLTAKSGNDLFVVNVKHMVFSEGFCPPCTVISLMWKRQIIKI